MASGRGKADARGGGRWRRLRATPGVVPAGEDRRRRVAAREGGARRGIIERDGEDSVPGANERLLDRPECQCSLCADGAYRTRFKGPCKRRGVYSGTAPSKILMVPFQTTIPIAGFMRDGLTASYDGASASNVV